MVDFEVKVRGSGRNVLSLVLVLLMDNILALELSFLLLFDLLPKLTQNLWSSIHLTIELRLVLTASDDVIRVTAFEIPKVLLHVVTSGTSFELVTFAFELTSLCRFQARSLTSDIQASRDNVRLSTFGLALILLNHW